jgi:Beta-propeller repeat/Abnormal spindle-like microcephaly-assoc'd, ASPM-SPD-2-Hydin
MKPTFVLGMCLSVSLTLAAQANPPDSARIVASYGKLPLAFEANQGQSDPQVKFLSRGAGYSLFLTSNEAVLALHEASRQEPALPGAKVRTAPEKISREIKSAVLHMKLVGSNAKTEVTGQDELAGKSNYFIGNDPKKWHTNVRQFGKVGYKNVYPGVDLVYYGHQRELEYDFVMQPGVNPQAIRLGIEGARTLRIERGDLVLTSAAGDVRLRRPRTYQEVRGTKQEIRGRYVITRKNEVGFEIGSYNRRLALIIDPVLAYSTYLEGSVTDGGNGIAVDAAGNAYVTGFTFSPNFPRANPLQPTIHGNEDAFVTKMNAEGTGLVYSTYLGGSGDDTGESIALDSSKNAYVTGTTVSSDFPTVNAIQPAIHGRVNAYITKINAQGAALVYSTYLGGSTFDSGTSIAVDSNRRVYVAGYTQSTDFPTLHAVQPTYGGEQDGFVTKISASGTALIYSTYVGGGGLDVIRGIAADSAGNAYVIGYTGSTDFPTVNPIQPTNHGGIDAFITKINATGGALVYSTYLGGSGSEGFLAGSGAAGRGGIAVDASGHAYVTGDTGSTDFPTKNALQNEFSGGVNVFATKINVQGNALVYSTYLGVGEGAGIAVDSAGNAYFVGPTDDPVGYPGAGTFVKELSATGNALLYSDTFGSSSHGTSVAVDSAGSIYVTGTTFSKHFPVTLLAFQKSLIGVWSTKAFVRKIAAYTFVSTSKPKLNFLRRVIGTTSVPKGITLTNQGSAVLTIKKIYIAGRNGSDFAETNNCGASLLAGTSCTISVTFGPSAIGDRNGVLGISDSDPTSPQALFLTGPGTAVSLSTTLLAFGKQPLGTTSAPMRVTLTNVVSTPLNFTGISVGGTDPDDFQQTNSCGTSIAGGARCTVTVTFKPTATGTRHAAVSISDDGGGSPQKVALTGTGT